MRSPVCLAILGLAVPLAFAQTSSPADTATVLSSAQASEHVGENRTVCGEIANEYTASTSHGTPMFVDLDQAYPHQIFDLVIWGDNKADVGQFPKAGKVCASGKIIVYRGRPEILLPDWHSWYVPRQN